jgi:hypothetical protein
VVTASVVIRGVVGALRLFHPDTEAFSPTQIESALRFVGVAEAQWPSLWAAVLEANARISPRSTVVQRCARFISSHPDVARVGAADGERRPR